MHSRCEDGHSLPSLTTVQYMGTLESLESLFMGTLAPLSRLCAFTYTAGRGSHAVHIYQSLVQGGCRGCSVHPLPSPHSPRTGSKGNPT